MSDLNDLGRAWAAEHADLHLMADVALDPSPWPAGFVRLAVSIANASGAEQEARRLFRAAVWHHPERTLEVLREALLA